MNFALWASSVCHLVTRWGIFLFNKMLPIRHKQLEGIVNRSWYFVPWNLLRAKQAFKWLNRLDSCDKTSKSYLKNTEANICSVVPVGVPYNDNASNYSLHLWGIFCNRLIWYSEIHRRWKTSRFEFLSKKVISRSAYSQHHQIIIFDYLGSPLPHYTQPLE